MDFFNETSILAFYKLVILIIFKKERVQENFFGKSLGKSYDTRRMFFWYLPPYVTYAKIFAQVDDHIWWFYGYCWTMWFISQRNQGVFEQMLKPLMNLFIFLMVITCHWGRRWGGEYSIIMLSPNDQNYSLVSTCLILVALSKTLKRSFKTFKTLHQLLLPPLVISSINTIKNALPPTYTRSINF